MKCNVQRTESCGNGVLVLWAFRGLGFKEVSSLASPPLAVLHVSQRCAKRLVSQMFQMFTGQLLTIICGGENGMKISFEQMFTKKSQRIQYNRESANN